MEEKRNWWKRMISRMFTVQSICLIVTIIAAAIGWVQCRDSRYNAEIERLQKIQEDRIKYHDDLILTLGGFELKNEQEYNIAILGAIDKNDKNYLFKFGVQNGGKLDVRNILIRFNSDKPIAIMKSMRMIDSQIYKERGGEINFEYFFPQEGTEAAIIFSTNDATNGAVNKCSFTCSCSDKAVPFSVKLNLYLYDFNSLKRFEQYVSSNLNFKDKYFEYWKGDNNFVMFLKRERVSKENLSYISGTYKIAIIDGEVRLQSVVTEDI